MPRPPYSDGIFMPKQPNSARPLTYSSGICASRSMTLPSTVSRNSRSLSRNARVRCLVGIRRCGKRVYELQRKATEEQLFGERRFIPTTFARFLGEGSRLLLGDLRLLCHRSLLANESHRGLSTRCWPEYYGVSMWKLRAGSFTVRRYVLGRRARSRAPGPPP